ncbi:MAG: adenylate/guanylate cyclase domain-containing protein [Pirellulaceae bacterium]|nr:adenylate/guanylate cyclase domain-containing protein [Pirellulaceae bacterium]
MADLIAQGSERDQRWRRELGVNETISIGRSQGWETPWDRAISQKHVSLHWDGHVLSVERIESARNPIFFRGTEVDSFECRAGQFFVIGQTTFTLSDEAIEVTLSRATPQKQTQFSALDLKRAKFRDVDMRMDLLGQLPDLIDYAVDHSELFQRLANVLLAGAVCADAVGIVSLEDLPDNDQQVSVFKWDRRRVTGKPFLPSQKLISQAVQVSETVLYEWDASRGQNEVITMAEDSTWAVACPVVGRDTKGWCLYLTGTDKGPETGRSDGTLPQLQDDIKFTEMVASVLSKLMKLRTLQKDRTTLTQFFSPLVLEAVAGRDPEQVLQPRQTDGPVLFCDLRGFSRQTEELADDLMGLLQRVSHVLGVSTQAILAHGGVVGDFHGDATMGFWGWPVHRGDEIEHVCRAALDIRRRLVELRESGDSRLDQFQMGLGIAFGSIVAGKIGTKDQVKVTAIGPAVNLAARLESLTRQLKASILIDAETSRYVREYLPPEVARVRRLAVVKPYGLREPAEVSELLPPHGPDCEMPDEQLRAFDEAWDCMVAGEWNAAFECLHQVPSDDRAKDFLTVYIAQHDRTPPADWEGFIPIARK